MKQSFSKTLKLPPAIGDWTQIHLDTKEEQPLQISKINSISFNSLGKKELEKLHSLHYRLAERAIKELSASMNIKIELFTVSVSQYTYMQFCKDQEGNRVQANYKINEKGAINLILEWALAFQLVDRLTGGKGIATDRDELTELEVTILETQMEAFTEILRESWKGVFKAEDVSLEFSTGQFKKDKKIAERDAYLVFELALSFGRGDLKTIKIGYANDTIRALLKAGENIKLDQKKTVSLDEKTLKKSMVDVSVLLGSAQLTMNEIRNLQPGDIVPLETSLTTPLELSIAGKVKFAVQPGVSRDRIALQILSQGTTQAEVPVAKEEKLQYEKEATETPAPVSTATEDILEDTEEEYDWEAEENNNIEDEPTTEPLVNEESHSELEEDHSDELEEEMWEEEPSVESPASVPKEEAVHEEEPHDDLEFDDEFEWDDDDEEEEELK